MGEAIKPQEMKRGDRFTVFGRFDLPTLSFVGMDGRWFRAVDERGVEYHLPTWQHTFILEDSRK